MTQAVKRACDACHRRKVKCDGVNPCRNCSQAQLSCTYNAIPQKKGPKGSRAKVISELRETQRQTSLSAKVQNRINGGPGAPPNPGLAPTPGLLTSELVKECIAFFFDNLYPQLPILDRNSVEQQVLYMEQNRDAYCLLTSLCAFVMLQPGMNMPAGDPYNLDLLPGATIVSSQLLIEEAVKVRKGYEYLDNISLNVLATDFFLFACHYGLEAHDRAWYYLREASTMIHLAGMHQEDHYMKLESVEASRRRRLFWLVYSTERAYALQRSRPLTLQATINLPTVNDDMTDPLAHQLNGFVVLSTLFKPFDDTFSSTWSKARHNLSPQYLGGLQKQLSDLVQSYICQDANFTDVHANQQWLKSTIWQLTNGAVNSGNDDSMSYQYSGNMSRDLLMSMASQFPNQGMELLNSGLIEKLLEVTHTAIDYLSLQPASRDPFAVGPREHMNQLLSVVAMSRNGDHRFLPLLLSKANEILPRLASPMLQNAPENPNMANVDIFDGFGNAGMAQPPQLQLSMDSDYDRKFPVEEYDKKYAMDLSSGTPESVGNTSSNGGPSNAPQGSEMGGSFVSSPGIMSPAVEYPPGINNFACTPMSEMVMSPLGHPSQPNPMNHAQHQTQHPTQHPTQHQTQHQAQHQHPHMSMNQGHEGMRQHHIGGMPQNMHSQPMNAQPVPPAMSMNNMVGMRQPAQRQASFNMHDPRQQYPAQAGMPGMGSMNNEMDFARLS